MNSILAKYLPYFHFGKKTNTSEQVSQSSLYITDNVKYKYFCDRIITFDKWPIAHFIKPVTLASLGFIYAYENNKPVDRVRCVFCNLVLYNFETTDNIAVEHAKYSPNCELVNMILPKSEEKIRSLDFPY